MKIVERKNILIEDTNISKTDLILKMIKNLELDDEKTEKLFKEVLEREKIDNTVLGFGVAIPHSKSNNVDDSYIVYCKLNKYIIWEEDEEEVNKVFLIVVPKNNPDKHIEILKDISVKMMNKEFREKLNESNDVDVIYKILNS